MYLPEEMDKKRILIIGAGIVGTMSIAVLKSDGFEPICYERSDNLGGTWCYRKETARGQASIMPTTILNHSKEMGALSDFPPNKEYSVYMRHSQVHQYLSDYAKSHDCERHIRYRMEVLRVEKSRDYDETGRWSVTSKNHVKEEVFTEIFDGVFVATGHINMPFMPKYSGQDKFKGQIIHSHGLKEVEAYAGKRVLVVGSGCSALDAAVGISRVAKQVYLSTRSGAYVWSRMTRGGYPTDYVLLRRYVTTLLNILPTNLCSWYLERFYLDTLFDHRLYPVEPKHHVLCREPSMNDFFSSRLLTGLIIQKLGISRFEENGVFIEGEEELTEIDAVIMATGYTWGYPFLEDGIITTDGNTIHLYKCIYPTQLPHPTLAILAFINVYGPGFPLAEMQIRWASYLLRGKGKLPSKEVMMKDVMRRYKENLNMYIPDEKLSIRVHYVQYMDEIGEEMGVKPNLLKYLVTDFPLFQKLLFGPSLSYHYRLDGHGKWEGARDAIMTSEERLFWPLTRKLPVKKGIILYILDYVVNLIPLNVYVWK